MSPRSLFIIVLRVLGIFSLKVLVLSILEFILNGFQYFTNSYFSFGLGMIILELVIVGLYFLVSYVLIFRAATLVDRFDLSRDIPNPLGFSINTRDILRIALVITAATLIISELPVLISNGIKMLKQDQLLFNQPVNWSSVVIPGVKVVIGLLLIGERKRLLDIFLKDQADEPADDRPTASTEEKDLFDDPQS